MTGMILLAALVLTLVSLVLGGLVMILSRALGRRPKLRWRAVGGFALAAFLLHAFVILPGAAGWFASRMPRTRGDESAWSGPRFTEDGRWFIQTRESLRAERRGELDPLLRRASRTPAVSFESSDGTPLRAFYVEAESPRAVVLMVHGLFRGGLELEPVAAMFRRAGCDVVLLELRNHGGSGRAPATFGLSESTDVVAAAEWLRQHPRAKALPLCLFGVSMGSAAVAMAVPRIDRIAALVLDAPMDDAESTAERMLTIRARRGRRGLSMRQPWRSLCLTSLELWSGFSLADVRPIDALARLNPEARVLVVGGSKDLRMPPDVVRAVFAAIPGSGGHRELWIREGSDHGRVWLDDPAGYEQRVRALVEGL